MAALNQSEEPKLLESCTTATMSCSELYQEFLKIEEHCEDSVASIISNFDALISKLKTNDDGNDDENNNNSHLQHLNNIELIRSMITKHPLSFKYKKLLHLGKKSIFINRFNKYYKTNDYSILSNTKTLIIGCGPAGLRMAIELALNGNKNIELIDSRDNWSRKQIVAIWNITESDLISFGIRDLLPKFTKNPHKKSIPITFLQHFLLRICLILGIKIRTNIEFKSIDFRKNIINLYNKNTSKLEQYTNDYDILLDATGTIGALRDCPIITHRHSLSSLQSEEQDEEKTKDDDEVPSTQRTTRSQSQSQSRSRSESKEDNDKEYGVEIIGSRKGSCLKKDIFGIVANFKRIRGDHKIEQILGKSYHFYQKEFDSKSIRLENIVYYRSDLTNYLVATVKKESLIAHNIFIQNKLRGKRLLKRDNINRDNLRNMILNVAQEWNIPHSRKKNPFNILSKGNEDFAVFEFGKLKIAKQPLKFINITQGQSLDDDDGKDKIRTQMIGCIGDAECAPFWPKGTGVNHAFIGIYLMLDVIKKWVKDKENDDIDSDNMEYLEEIEINTKKEFDVLHSDLNDKIWHQKRIGNTYLPEYKVAK